SSHALLERDPTGQLPSRAHGGVADLIGDAVQMATRHDQNDPLALARAAEEGGENHSRPRPNPLAYDSSAFRPADQERDLRARAISVGYHDHHAARVAWNMYWHVLGGEPVDAPYRRCARGRGRSERVGAAERQPLSVQVE